MRCKEEQRTIIAINGNFVCAGSIDTSACQFKAKPTADHLKCLHNIHLFSYISLMLRKSCNFLNNSSFAYRSSGFAHEINSLFWTDFIQFVCARRCAFAIFSSFSTILCICLVFRRTVLYLCRSVWSILSGISASPAWLPGKFSVPIIVRSPHSFVFDFP